MEEERLLNRTLLKIFMLSLKVIPMVIAFIYFINTLLSYIGVNPKVFNYIGHIGLIPLVFLYLASYVLHFCEYHRMFLHYIVVIEIINLIDCYIGIPVDNFVMFMIYSIITIISLFLLLYFKKLRI